MQYPHRADSNYQAQALLLLHELDDIATPDLYDQQLAQLRKLGQTSLIIGLCELLSHPNAAIRCQAGELLLLLDAERNLGQIVSLLKDPDENVRFVITRWLCVYGDERAIDALIDVLMHDSSGTARSYAAIALGNIGDTRALSILRHVARHDQGVNYEGEPVRSTANQAIEQIMKQTTPLDNDCA